MEIPRDDVLTKKMIQGYPSFRGRFVLSVHCLMDV